MLLGLVRADVWLLVRLGELLGLLGVCGHSVGVRSCRIAVDQSRREVVRGDVRAVLSCLVVLLVVLASVVRDDNLTAKSRRIEVVQLGVGQRDSLEVGCPLLD